MKLKEDTVMVGLGSLQASDYLTFNDTFNLNVGAGPGEPISLAEASRNTIIIIQDETTRATVTVSHIFLVLQQPLTHV